MSQSFWATPTHWHAVHACPWWCFDTITWLAPITLFPSSKSLGWLWTNSSSLHMWRLPITHPVSTLHSTTVNTNGSGVWLLLLLDDLLRGTWSSLATEGTMSGRPTYRTLLTCVLISPTTWWPLCCTAFHHVHLFQLDWILFYSFCLKIHLHSGCPRWAHPHSSTSHQCFDAEVTVLTDWLIDSSVRCYFKFGWSGQFAVMHFG